MKKRLLICILLLGALSLSSCSSRYTAINNLESLVNEVENEGETYTLADWSKLTQKCVRIERELNKHEYTPEENREIGKLKGRLGGIVAKDILEDLYKITNTLKEQFNGGINGFLEEFLK